MTLLEAPMTYKINHLTSEFYPKITQIKPVVSYSMTMEKKYLTVRSHWATMRSTNSITSTEQ